MPKYSNRKFKKKSDNTMDPLYDLDKMSEREVVWPSPKTPEVSSVVQFIIDNSTAGRNYTSGNHPNVLLPSGYVKEEEVLSRDSGSEGDYTVLGVSPSITPSLACEVLITENSQLNGEKSKQAPQATHSRSGSSTTAQNCLREIDLSMNHNSNNQLNGTGHMLKSDEELKEEIIDYEEPDEDDLDDLDEAELNVDETEAMKQLGYCIHRITYFKLYNEQIDTVKCSACDEVIGKTVRETSSVVKLEFTCNYCDLTFDLIGDLNMHLINHYHEIETGRPVLYET
uniref:C2H2-type domain-containing protein n=2 Tax=Cacopsylla melanoneura TaxID=428564 RepID=A0A8D8RSM4_9HEMI